MGKFVIKPAKNGDCMFNLKADNGQVILTSEVYTTKAACNNGIASVQKNCVNDDRYERKVAVNKKHYFVLKAGNGQVIGKSEYYEAEAGMENGISSVKKNGVSTNVVEE
jgi:uncharacterized protein YegP (UPF0339 family)